MGRGYCADLLLPSLLCVLAISPRPVIGAGSNLARAASASLCLFVDTDATGANSGATWTDAYRDLQDALAAARRSGGTIREIWVAAGTYRPDRRTGDRTVSFCLLSGVALYGGFAGGETHLAQRDIEANETVLSGDLAGNDGPGFANNGENSYHVVMSTGTVTRAVLDGFTIASGNANVEYGPWWTYAHGYGGGLLNNHGNLSLANVTFRNNAAANGGGLCNWGGAPALTNCTFVGNMAIRHGGALLNRETEREFFCNLRFFGNRSSSGGGAIWNDVVEPTFVNCVFSGNATPHGGGAVLNYAGDGTWINCTFSGNEGGGPGGAMLTDHTPNLMNCIFWNNRDGSGIGESAQVYFYEPKLAVIEHNCIQGWTGAWGGSGNFGLDPRLADAHGPDGVAGTFDDDLRLRPGSPCIDAGDNTRLPADAFDLDGDGDSSEPIPLDLAGGPRLRGGTVDRGAYETAGEPPARLYVDTDATGANDGTSWADAFNGLQDALDAAARWPGDIREIWVADGTYTPDRGTGDREATFQLVSGVAVYGGFAGSETELNQRDIAANETILSGDLRGDDGPNFANNGENSYHVVSADVTDSATILDGFTIRRGNANGAWEQGQCQGGGVYSRNGPLTIKSCTFTANAADYGGGVSNEIGTLAMVGCMFRGNRAIWSGGALSSWERGSTFVNCTFVGNTAEGGGGAASADGTFVNCRFSGNTAFTGGGMYMGTSTASLINCTFHGNRAAEYGGGFCSGVESDISMSNCILWGNEAPRGPQIALLNEHWDTTLEVTYSDVEGSSSAIYAHHGYPPIVWGAGNVAADPAFVAAGHWEDAGTTDPADDPWVDGDYRFQPGSPCIDAADNAAVPPFVLTDLDGNARFVDDPRTPDTGNGTPPIADMGIYEYAPLAGLHAHIRILPRTLNLKSRGRWITCYIELPEPHDVGDIDVGSLLLNGRVHAAARPATVGDYDGDGIADLMVKFPRAEVIAILSPGEAVVVTVTGLVAGSPFAGADTIRVVNPGIGPRSASPGQLLQFCIAGLAEGLTGRVAFSAENLPPGSTLDGRTGLFRWTPGPGQVGIYPGVVFRASNGDGEVVEAITITVARLAGVRASVWKRYE